MKLRGFGVPLAVAAVLAVPGAARATSPPPAKPAPAGDIQTVAGGVGGPGPAGTVTLANIADGVKGPCGLAYGAGRLFIGDAGSVRSVSPRSGWLTTPAGTGLPGPFADGGPAASANLYDGCGVAVDHRGNLLITDGGHARVRVVAASTGSFYGQPMTAGHIYTVAGNGVTGAAGNGGRATQADVTAPASVAVDAAGNLVIVDGYDPRAGQGGNAVRVVAHRAGTFYGQPMKPGHIYLVAGNGTPGYSGDGGPATAAELSAPSAAVPDAAGNLLIADTYNDRIRVVAGRTGTFYGQPMTAGDIYTVAGDGTGGFSGDGGPATAAELNQPAGLDVDAAGNLLIADARNNRIRVVAGRTGTFYGQPMTAGDIYTVAGDGVRGFAGDGGPATAAEFRRPSAVAVDGAGNLVIADTGNGRVRVVARSTGSYYGQPMTAGDIYGVAGTGDTQYSGNGGPASAAEMLYLAAVGLDQAGNVLIADQDDSLVWVAAHRTGTYYGRAMTAGHIYIVASGHAGNGGPATVAGPFVPADVAADAAGNLLIADQGGNRIRVVAGQTGRFYGRAMTAGQVYTVAGNGTAGFSGDGGPATAAELLGPTDVMADGAGNLLIADRSNSRVRVVAARTGTFYGQAMTAGDIYTIAGDGTGWFTGDGGPATAAGMDPERVALDHAGNLLIDDSGDCRIRVVAARTGTFYGQAMTAGDIYTVAGDGVRGFAGDGGPATAAELGDPDGLAVDHAGNLVISDWLNDRVRVVAARTGTFYGQAMTAGDIYTIAGNGAAGFSGDGGPATAAELASPDGLAVDRTGNVLVADLMNDRIREITG